MSVIMLLLAISCRWSVINSLYGPLFTMHEMEPSVKVCSTALSEGDMFLLSAGE